MCSAYAAPIDNNEDAEVQIAPALMLGASLLPMLTNMIGGKATLQDYDTDDAEAQIVPAVLLGASLLPMLTNMIGGVQDEEDDDNAAQIEKLLESLQDKAETERLGSALGKLGKRYGPSVLKGAKKFGERYGEQILDSLVSRLITPTTLLQDKAETEGVGKMVGNLGKKYGPTVLKGAKKYGKKLGERYGEQILDSLVDRLVNGKK